MSQRDTEYYRQRAATEREHAKASERANVAAIHEELARQYEALVDHPRLRVRLRGASDLPTNKGIRSRLN